MSEQPSKEQRILAVLRKTLTNVVRDVTPPPGMKSVLSDHTVADIRDALTLITVRERELLEEAGGEPLRPYFIDEPQPVAVPIGSIKKQ